MIGMFWVGVFVYICGTWALDAPAFWQGLGAGVGLAGLMQSYVLHRSP